MAKSYDADAPAEPGAGTPPRFTPIKVLLPNRSAWSDRHLPALRAMQAIIAQDGPSLLHALTEAEAVRPALMAELVTALEGSAAHFTHLAALMRLASDRVGMIAENGHAGSMSVIEKEQNMNKFAELHEVESPSAAAHRGTIQQLNDVLRVTGQGGRLVLTPGVRALGPERVAALVAAVAAFDAFTPENDPHSEHDFGAVEVSGDRYYWKIDYYGHKSPGHSLDAADTSVTLRVLTIMRADEY